MIMVMVVHRSAVAAPTAAEWAMVANSCWVVLPLVELPPACLDGVGPFGILGEAPVVAAVRQ